jgi:hypothetical protein
MKRREFLALLGGSMAISPIVALAQQSGKFIRIGFFGASLDSPGGTIRRVFNRIARAGI